VEILKEEVRREDLVARYGGEEFALLLPKTTAAAARQLAERLRARVEAEVLEMADGRQLRFTISMGIAEYLPAGPVMTPGELVELADRALFRAKKLGRNRVETAPVGVPQ
jgi:diguanylate cyclase (GGDEF)-like protein